MRFICDRLLVERGGRLVIQGLSFIVESGAALVVTGPNGAGKSTLLRTIAGLVHHRAGAIRLVAGDDDKTIPEHCHYFGHLDGIKTALTVAENVAFWQGFYGIGTGFFRVDAALGEVGIDHLRDLPTAYLSAGQRRRLSLCRLLVAHRPIWLLDEPTSALDAASETKLIALVNRHLAEGGIVIAATHSPLSFCAMTVLELTASVAA